MRYECFITHKIFLNGKLTFSCRGVLGFSDGSTRATLDTRTVIWRAVLACRFAVCRPVSSEPILTRGRSSDTRTRKRVSMVRPFKSGGEGGFTGNGAAAPGAVGQRRRPLGQAFYRNGFLGGHTKTRLSNFGTSAKSIIQFNTQSFLRECSCIASRFC